MRAKRISSDEQLRLVMECRRSGLSDYQWCQENDINPGTFYNWISRLRKKGASFPDPASGNAMISHSRQEVVKVELLPEPAIAAKQVEQNTCLANDIASGSKPAIEVIIGNITIHFFNDADERLVETTLRCLGGTGYAG